MENEISNFVKVWVSVILSLWYCYAISKAVPKGTTRLLVVLPVVFFFLYLPLNLTTMHLGGPSAFFIGWLANFKLLLFAFGKGPLSSDPSISLPHFVAVGCLPIKMKVQYKHEQPPKSPTTTTSFVQNRENPYTLSNQDGINRPKGLKLLPQIIFALKGVILAVVVYLNNYSEYLHPIVILFLNCLHVYLLLERILTIVAVLARALLGIELEPQFNEPYLSTSLQDFWSRRWNLMVPSILRPTVYEPILNATTCLVGRKWAPVPATLGTFFVSGLMHELIFYYLGRMWPTWELTWFFLLHGVCLTLEIAAKKTVMGRWQLPWLISGPLTVGFVMATGCWLFFPSLYRCGAFVRGAQEYAALCTFFTNVIHHFRVFWSLNIHQKEGL
ncbi:MBOAT_2 domain-containing protein [Cephalotus follicularis]|uniref:MBOAT_2 domain-containing protein n=1 Tax=Cephalotus follicularis TaxID=3775 RepID=A0A1Q3CIP6_CEPFO|nr:MBOAT_2 domain-containing protein [Cephalotus follicularis]